uniref:Uncharacterized protein n=1 Tax=viral metagenome TaxID=1070528 RepID=A0A6M3XX30_9ZZZZ
MPRKGVKDEKKQPKNEFPGFAEKESTGPDPLAQPENVKIREGTGNSAPSENVSKGGIKMAKFKKEKLKENEEDKEEIEKQEEDLSDLDEDEKKTYRALKARVKKVKKGEGLPQNPEEAATEAADAGHSTTPKPVIESKPDIFVPPSEVEGDREQDIPNQELGKSAKPDLTKSPLFVNVTKQLEGIKAALSKKVDDLEKSVNDRLKNIHSDMEKIEKFYQGSFYKAASDEVGPEGLNAMPITKQIEKGKARFSS